LVIIIAAIILTLILKTHFHPFIIHNAKNNIISTFIEYFSCFLLLNYQSPFHLVNLLQELKLLKLSSCATVLGGRVTECQRTKPKTGQPSREIRAGALIADIFLGLVWVGVDFATGAIYKPYNNK